jgi:hypothetical protein
MQDSATRAHSCKRLHLVIWVGKNEAHAVILSKRRPPLDEGFPTSGSWAKPIHYLHFGNLPTPLPKL